MRTSVAPDGVATATVAPEASCASDKTIPITTPKPAVVCRADLGLPDDRFIWLFAFDTHSDFSVGSHYHIWFGCADFRQAPGHAIDCRNFNYWYCLRVCDGTDSGTVFVQGTDKQADCQKAFTENIFRYFLYDIDIQHFHHWIVCAYSCRVCISPDTFRQEEVEIGLSFLHLRACMGHHLYAASHQEEDDWSDISYIFQPERHHS